MAIERPAVHAFGPGLLLIAASCGAGHAVRSADREVAEILEKVEREHVASRIPGLVRPVELPPESRPASGPGPETPPPDSAPVEGSGQEPPASQPAAQGEPLRLGVREAIRLAVFQSRDYRSQVESLYLQALSLSGTRRQFSPQLTGVLGYTLSQTYANAFANGHSISGPRTYTGSASLGVSQILPLGGTFSLSGSENVSVLPSPGEIDVFSHSASFSASYRQSLLRGVGYEASHESLIQAERSMIYAAREFELFRQDFTIRVADRFYGLVAQQRVLENTKVRATSAANVLARSEALHRVGQLNRVDLYRAQQDALTARNDVLEREQGFRDALDEFKIFLGLPTDARLEIAPEEPEFRPVSVELTSAIAAAEANRLDFRTTQDQLEDSQRSVRIAVQGLRADLDLDVTAGLSTPASFESFAEQELTAGSLTAGVSLGLPLNRKSERNAYRSAVIGLDRARRAADLARDNLALEVRRTLRELERARLTLDIQRRTIESEERRVRIATIQFRAGNVSNRDVVEAERGLLDAKNAEIEQRVRYEIARLQLRRILGTLLLEGDGLWVEES